MSTKQNTPNSFEIDREVLKNALEAVRGGLTDKTIIDQADSFAFLDDCVVTFNDRVSISCPLANFPVRAAVKADDLYHFLERLKVEKIGVTVTDSELQFTAGRIRAGIVIDPVIRLPLEMIATPDHWFKLPDLFMETLNTMAPICSKDMSSPIYTTIHVRPDGLMEATDRYRVLQMAYVKEGKINWKNDFLIPADMVQHISKIKPQQMSISDKWLHFKNEAGIILSIGTFAAKYPDVDAFINIDVNGVAELTFPNGITAILERAEVFSHRKVFTDEIITCAVQSKKLIITTTAENNTGWFEEQCAIKYAREPFEFSINPRVLQTLLKYSNTCYVLHDTLFFKSERYTYVGALSDK